MPVECRRVVKSFLAIQANQQTSKFSTVEVGSILYIEADLWQPGLMPMSLSGENLLTFARDLRECTEVVDLLQVAFAAAASRSGFSVAFQASRAEGKAPQREQPAGKLKKTG